MNLKLTLKRQWFEMIESGEKLEEYREIKDYWARRLLFWKCEQEDGTYCEMLEDMRNPTRSYSSVDELMEYFGVSFRPFTSITFVNGYSKNAPRFDVKCLGITIAKGNPEWGADPDQYYFVLKLSR
jgi:hypothetical protein